MPSKRSEIKDFIGNIGWWLYVKTKWRYNKVVQKNLDANVRDNLGYYLRESHPNFK
jgi:hypothetical protein